LCTQQTYVGVVLVRVRVSRVRVRSRVRAVIDRYAPTAPPGYACDL